MPTLRQEGSEVWGRRTRRGITFERAGTDSPTAQTGRRLEYDGEDASIGPLTHHLGFPSTRKWQRAPAENHHNRIAGRISYDERWAPANYNI